MPRPVRNTKRSKEHCVKSYCGEIVVGVDSHKKDYHVVMWNVEDDGKLQGWVQPSDDQALMNKLEPYRSQIKLIVYEAGSVGFTLVRNLIAAGWPAIVTSPGDIPTSRNEPKSDRRDAMRLAKLGARGLLQPIYVPTPEQEYERGLQRQRQQFLKDRKRHQLRIKMALLNWGIKLPDTFRWKEKETRELPCLVTNIDQQLILEGYLEAYFLTHHLVKRCDTQLENLKGRSHNKSTIRHLTTIGGIGSRTALEFKLEMGSAGRFETKHQVAKYQGLAPDVRSSGQSRKEGPLNRSGNRRLKTLLIEAAWRWTRYDPHAKTYYNHMFSNTGCAQKAITAVAHKLGIVMWNIMEKQTDYVPGGINPRSRQKDTPQTSAATPSKRRPTHQAEIKQPRI